MAESSNAEIEVLGELSNAVLLGDGDGSRVVCGNDNGSLDLGVQLT